MILITLFSVVGIIALIGSIWVWTDIIKHPEGE